MLTVFVFPSTESNKRLERTRLERASLVSCVGEPLKRNVGRFMLETRIMKSNVQSLLLTPIFLGALSCGDDVPNAWQPEAEIVEIRWSNRKCVEK